MSFIDKSQTFLKEKKNIYIYIYICIHRWGRAWRTDPEQVTDGARKKHRMWRQSHFPMTEREKFKQLSGSYESQRLWAQGCPRWRVTGVLRQESWAPCFPFGTGPTTEKKKCEGWVMRGLEKCSQFPGLSAVYSRSPGRTVKADRMNGLLWAWPWAKKVKICDLYHWWSWWRLWLSGAGMNAA